MKRRKWSKLFGKRPHGGFTRDQHVASMIFDASLGIYGTRKGYDDWLAKRAAKDQSPGARLQRLIDFMQESE